MASSRIFSSICATTFVFAFALVPHLRSVPQRDTHIPNAGFVPDAQTAVRIAEAVIVPIYGDALLQREKPLAAELKETGVWVVRGSPPPDALKAGWRGGVVLVEISKASGCILRVTHPK